MKIRFNPCVCCGREAAYHVTIELRSVGAGPFEVPDETRRAYVCPRCLETRYADLFGGFRGDPWPTR